MDWNNVVSAVATDEGLLVTERGADGQVGAPPRLMPYAAPTAVRRPAPKILTKGGYKYRIVECSRWVQNPGAKPVFSTYLNWICVPKKTTQAATDQEAWKQIGYQSISEQLFGVEGHWESCVRLERLEGSQWVTTSFGGNCGGEVPPG